MTSPFVRRRRLAAEIRTLREERGMTTDELARRIHQSRMKISKLENARIRPDLAEIMRILDVLGVTGERWQEIIRIARDAAEKGWWSRNERIWHVIVPLGLAALGLMLAAAAQSPLLMLLALALSLAGTLAYNGPFFSLPATFLAGTAAAGGIGFINTIGSLGRFVGPWMVGVLKQESGGYSSAMAALAMLMLGATLLVFVMGRLMAVRKLRYS